MKRAEIEARTEELLAPILEEGNFILWDVSYVKEGKDFYLRVFVDKEGGIDINDCVDISRKLDEKMEAEDYITDAYTLEVSSPGLTRPLHKDREMSLSIGRLVFVKLYAEENGAKEFLGTLKDFDAEHVTILADTEITFTRKNISQIRLEFED